MKGDFSFDLGTKDNAVDNSRTRCTHAKLTAENTFEQHLIAAVRRAIFNTTEHPEIEKLTDAMVDAVIYLEKEERDA